ncbi:hypothetical protein [Ruegeria arenilitoris]|uniref:hypothetical protein n=1 Tax=Ruegeria arenilitoris TaxID=1173585 RepID=UPI00147C4A78|nr:hypothetical protein [Ruegeria arenilitoris]
MAGNNYFTPRLPQHSKFLRYGTEINVSGKYRRIVRQIAYCHDTHTRFDTATCAKISGDSVRTVERVLPILAEAGVVEITHAKTRRRQVKLTRDWLEYYRARLPQVAKLRDGKRAKDVAERRISGAFAEGAETVNPARAGGNKPRHAGGVDGLNPATRADITVDMGHAHVNGIAPNGAVGGQNVANDALAIEAPGDWVLVRPWDE